MSREAGLSELDRALAGLPEESYRHCPAVADDFMADWISRQRQPRRDELLDDLTAWLLDHGHPWHDDAALEIAIRLQHQPFDPAARQELRSTYLRQLNGNDMRILQTSRHCERG